MSHSLAPTMLELRDVSLSYPYRKSAFEHGKNNVLESVSLDVHESETLGIIGKNGVGKTTILRIMGEIIAPTSGTVRRRPGTSVALLTIGLGFKPQLSGRDNAKLAAMLAGATSKEAEVHLDEIKEFSELGIQFCQREPGLCDRFPCECVARKLMQEHLVNGLKEAFYTTTSTRHTRG